MISFDEAIERIRSVARPLGTESVALSAAAGRVLAQPVVAQIDSPRSDVSAMDGYAVRDEDLTPFPVALDVVGESFPGQGWSGAVAPGTCVRIFTGAPVPRGANRIVIQEIVRRDGATAIVDEHPGAATYIRPRGSDLAAGEELLPAGRLLDPRGLVAAAAADVAELEVYRRPRLHILSTGDELAEPGTARDTPDAVPDSASLGVAALAAEWGADCIGQTRLRDEMEEMQPAAGKAVAAADLITVIGGASVGDKDFAKAMFEPLGLELIFAQLAIKPGKPAWLGRVGDKLVIGLPGNPTSALVTARLLLAPLLAGLTGRPLAHALPWRTMPLATPLGACGARETFHRARTADGAAHILPFQDSHAQKALAEADLLARQRAHAPAAGAGELVDVLDF
jgi:molybdopterin molybdotransferase